MDLTKIVQEQNETMKEMKAKFDESRSTTTSMFKKLQDYVNQQTEYMNGVINSKDDQLESLAEQLQKIMGNNTHQLSAIAEEAQSPALNMEGIEKIQHEINEKLR